MYRVYGKSSIIYDLQNEVVTDVTNLWVKASLPALSKCRIQTKLLDIVKKLKSAKKRSRKKF